MRSHSRRRDFHMTYVTLPLLPCRSWMVARIHTVEIDGHARYTSWGLHRSGNRWKRADRSSGGACHGYQGRRRDGRRHTGRRRCDKDEGIIEGFIYECPPDRAVWKGMLAGLAGGLAASWTMNAAVSRPGTQKSDPRTTKRWTAHRAHARRSALSTAQQPDAPMRRPKAGVGPLDGCSVGCVLALRDNSWLPTLRRRGVDQRQGMMRTVGAPLPISLGSYHGSRVSSWSRGPRCHSMPRGSARQRRVPSVS